jgi:mannan endo-1,4-beta-mannosidase
MDSMTWGIVSGPSDITPQVVNFSGSFPGSDSGIQTRYPRAVRRLAVELAVALLAACDAPLPGPATLQAEASACELGEPHTLPGEDGPVVLLDAYYLQEVGARAVRRGEALSAEMEEVLGEAAAMGVRVIRTNGFDDDPAGIGDATIQIAPLEYDEVALRGLDLVLARAAAHGLRLVLTLGNYWDDYGGARQYVAWAGLPDPRTGDPRFFTDAGVRTHYAANIAALLSRTSTVDGYRYGEHPAVLAWELLNEPRGGGLDDGGAAVRAWVDEMGAVVHALAPGHLVGTGEEGWELPGASWALDTASTQVDYGSVHLFPEAWGVDDRDAASFGASWISGHARAAAALGKPLLVAEFALRRAGAFDLARRRAIYRGWLGCARAAGAAAAGPWMFAYDARPASGDDSSFAWIDGTAADDPRNEYVDVLQDVAAAW